MIYVTRGSSDSPATIFEIVPEKVSENVDTVVAGSAFTDNTARDPEKCSLGDLVSQKRPVRDFKRGRPNIGHLMSAAISHSSASLGNIGHVMVGACGPKELIDTTRQAVLHEKHDDGPSMTLYTEVSQSAPALTKSQILRTNLGN